MARETKEPPLHKAAEPTDNKRATRLEYYQGVRQGMVEHIQVTEEKLRNLEGIKAGKVDKLVADLHKIHDKLLKRVDREIKLASARNR